MHCAGDLVRCLGNFNGHVGGILMEFIEDMA